MRTGALAGLLVAFSVSPLPAQGSAPSLTDGVISYTGEGGARLLVQAGGPCTDLWVSPDESAIAFIRIDRSLPDPSSVEPFIEESTVFLARRLNGFLPVRISFAPPKIDGRLWRVFRNPVLSPDLKTIYFLVPAAGTSWFLMRASTTGGAARPISFIEGYCVLWGGERSGDVLVMARHMGSPEEGLTHWFYRVGIGATMDKVGSSADGDLGKFLLTWTRKYGGTCQRNAN